MQAIARELGFSETAFVIMQAGGTFPLRWFTPTTEVDLCGHATLASAHALWEAGLLERPTASFSTRSGLLSVARWRGLLRLDLPAAEPIPAPPPASLAATLGCDVRATAVCAVREARDLVVELADEDSVARLAPDLRCLHNSEWRAVLVTAPAQEAGADYVLRVFAPRVGIPEDPATGSAHCALGPYWARRCGRPELRARQLSARGGEFTVTVGDEMPAGRVGVAGQAVTIVRGTCQPRTTDLRERWGSAQAQ